MTTEKSTEARQLEILEIGGNIKPQAHLVPEWKDAVVLQLDVDPEQKPDILADAGDMPEELLGRFDGIFASHVLEHFAYWRTKEVLKGWIDCLKPDGELHIVVPSWEWAAREILADKPSPALMGHSFAGQVNEWDVHRAMFTMRLLRKLFADMGLHVTKAVTGQYAIQIAEGKVVPAEEHYVVGKRVVPELRKE